MSAISPESWKALSPLLDRVLDMPESERTPWLHSLHQSDPALATQLRILLEEHHTLAQAQFLESGPTPRQASIGAYRLINLIGEGGMGTVWLAERSDGQLQQIVAIKLLRPGADRPALKQRFLKERQFLANLNHPAIARLLDAGETPDGRPYLIMEYVDGVPIDVYASSLGIREIVTLVLTICDAVSHAHRRLIVHRDLKPSNILVDRAGQPKLLDFGIAKLLDDASDATRTIDRLLTPLFASPEQFHGQPQTIATDIYSLGAVLYKLLTGRSPHQNDAEAIIPGARPLTPPSHWRSDLPKDLDFILAKALRLEPEERYPTVDALSADLQAFLQHSPISARSGERSYRLRKFFRRHWLPTAAATVAIAALITGAVLANRQRTAAQRRFAQVRQLANRVLTLDLQLRTLPGTTKVRQEVVGMSQQYLEGLRQEARLDNTLAFEIAVSYLRLARVQGIPISPNLGQYAQAEQSLVKGVELIQSILSVQPSHRGALSAATQASHDLMILADSGRRPEEALAHARQAIEYADRLTALGNLSSADLLKVLEVTANVALAHKNQHRYEEAIRYAMRIVDYPEPGKVEPSTQANAWSIVADARRATGNLDGALVAITHARNAVQKDGGRSDFYWSFLFNVLWREGLIRGAAVGPSLNQTTQAVNLLTQAFDVIEQEARKDPNDSASRIRFASAGRELGAVLRTIDPSRALSVYDIAIARLAEVPSNAKARRGQAELLAASSYPLHKLNRPVQARQRIDQALNLLRAVKDYPAERFGLDSELATTLRALADHHAATAQPPKAAAAYEELLSKIMATNPDPENDLRNAASLSTIYSSLAALHRRNGRTAEEAAVNKLRLALWHHWDRKLPANRYILHQLETALPKD